MSLQAVSTYLSARLKEVDPAFKEHTDAFNTDNVGASSFDKGYHTLITEMRCGPANHQITTDVASVEMTLFFKGFRDPKEYLTRAFDIANAFRLNAMNPEFSHNDALIKGVVCTSIKPVPGEGNDNVIKMKAFFDMTLCFETE